MPEQEEYPLNTCTTWLESCLRTASAVSRCWSVCAALAWKHPPRPGKPKAPPFLLHVYGFRRHVQAWTLQDNPKERALQAADKAAGNTISNFWCKAVDSQSRLRLWLSPQNGFAYNKMGFDL